MIFIISKSFARLELHPTTSGLKIVYTPVQNGEPAAENAGAVTLHVPIVALGGVWATTRAFLYGVESLDENIILHGKEGDTLIKLYRDKPMGANGKLTGEEVCWLRIVTGRSEEERRRIKLGQKDLLCLELACNAVLVLANGIMGAQLSNGVMHSSEESNEESSSLASGKIGH